MNDSEMRELDAWIAAHVMGWKAPLGYRDLRADVFQPTQSSNDAMEVLKKCRDAGWLITIKIIPKEFSYIIEGSRSEYDAPCEDRECCKGKVMVEGMNMNNREDWQRHETFADTIELAICLFAKKLFNPKIPRNESPTTDCDPIPRTSHT